MEAHSNNSTQLNKRTLWFDGTSTVEPDVFVGVYAHSPVTDGWFVSELTDDIKRYNALVEPKKQINIKKTLFEQRLDFTIPAEYLKINVDDYIQQKLAEELEDYPESAAIPRITRALDELKLYKQLGLIDVLRTLIYIINTLQTHNVVWGVGRGSSVASYVLYLIGVHDVDSVEYECDITDFLRPNDGSGE